MSLLLSVFARLLPEQTDHQIVKTHPAGACLPVHESPHGRMDVHVHCGHICLYLFVGDECILSIQNVSL